MGTTEAQQMVKRRPSQGTLRLPYPLRDQERALTIGLGAGSFLLGLRRSGIVGFGMSVMGMLLAYRGWMNARSGPVHFITGTSIERPPKELYEFWHDFTRLPEFLSFISDIQNIGERRTHWVARSPGAGSVEWDAEVVEDVENERIAWRSLEGSDLHHQGAVRFRPAHTGQGTEIELDIRFEPPGGLISKAVGRLLSTATKEAAREDLRRFKRLMEAGEVPSGVKSPKSNGGAR